MTGHWQAMGRALAGMICISMGKNLGKEFLFMNCSIISIRIGSLPIRQWLLNRPGRSTLGCSLQKTGGNLGQITSVRWQFGSSASPSEEICGRANAIGGVVKATHEVRMRLLASRAGIAIRVSRPVCEPPAVRTLPPYVVIEPGQVHVWRAACRLLSRHKDHHS
jgi:hypothetical protein